MVGILIVHRNGRTGEDVAAVAAVEAGNGANDRIERRYGSLVVILDQTAIRMNL